MKNIKLEYLYQSKINSIGRNIRNQKGHHIGLKSV